MGFDPVPWAVGGGAEHSPEIARLIPFVALGGAEGVVSPGDMKVTAQTAPNGTVKVSVGACAILYKNGGQQTYLARHPSETVVSVASTGASARTDLIVAQIEDPFLTGSPYPSPANPAVGPYVAIRVLSNTSTLPAGLNAIVLARITRPANDTIVENADITDLRALVQPRTQRFVTMNGPTPEVQMVAAGGAVWPDYRPSTLVPPWATHVTVMAYIVSIGQRNGIAKGVINTTLGPSGATQFRASNVPYDLEAFTSMRHTLMVGGSGTLNPALRGTTQTLGLEASRTTGPGYLVTVAGTQVIYDVTFDEKTV